jgi:branched-chain amino acid aminotransferase
MFVFLNGQIVPEEQAVVSVFDRSFLYGDGLFETMLVLKGKPFRWEHHLERLERGAEFLRLRIPFSREALRGFADELIAWNRMPESLLRLTLSRGVGRRGYSPQGAERPFVVMSLHPAPVLDAQNPPRWRLVISSLRLPANQSLAQFKTCNKLPQILARTEADAAGAEEALLLNTDGFVVEASSSNLFWIQGEAVCTPALVSGILAGVTRTVVFELCRTLGLETRETNITLPALKQTQGVFLSLSSYGIAEGISLDGQPLAQSGLTARIRAAYGDLLSAEK